MLFNFLKTRSKGFEILILLGIIIFVLFMYHFPEYYAAFHTPKGMVYLGQNSFYDPWDINFYVSAVRYGQREGIPLPNLYTTGKNTPVFLYSVLTGIGYIFKTINPFFLYHLSILFTGILLIITFFSLTKKLGLSTRLSLYATVIICLSGGIGFLFSSNTSLNINDAPFSFYNTFQKPHEAIAVICYTASLILFFLGVIKNKLQFKDMFLISLLLSIALFIYPYLLLSFFLIMFLFLVIYRKTNLTRKDFINLSIVSIPSIIIVLFIYNQLYLNPTFKDITSNLTFNVLSLLLSFGIPFLIFMYQLFYLPKSNVKTFLSIWFIITVILGLLPFGPGRVFFRGLFFPTALLCILSLHTVMALTNNNRKYLVYGLFGVLITAASFNIFIKRITQLNLAYSDWVYVSAREFKIFQFLNEHTEENSSVIALYRLGNLIPAYTHNTVYFGHFLQTPDGINKFNTISVFYYNQTSPEVMKEFLKKNSISYVIFGEREKAFLSTNPDAGKIIDNPFPYLTLVYNYDDIKIYSTQKRK